MATQMISKKWLYTSWLMVAGFLCYTGMYAVRKSFLAGQYVDLALNRCNRFQVVCALRLTCDIVPQYFAHFRDLLLWPIQGLSESDILDISTFW